MSPYAHICLYSLHVKLRLIAQGFQGICERDAILGYYRTPLGGILVTLCYVFLVGMYESLGLIFFSPQ